MSDEHRRRDALGGSGGLAASTSPTPRTYLGSADVLRRPALELRATRDAAYARGADDAPVLSSRIARHDDGDVGAQVPVLRGPLRVLRVDQPGHGGSPVPGGRIAVDDLARTRPRLLDDLESSASRSADSRSAAWSGMWLASERARARRAARARAAPSARFGDRRRCARARGDGPPARGSTRRRRCSGAVVHAGRSRPAGARFREHRCLSGDPPRATPRAARRLRAATSGRARPRSRRRRS